MKLGQLLSVLGLLAFIVFGKSEFSATERTGELRAWFFDVGQGDAILLDTPTEQQILIDGGPGGQVVGHLSRAMKFGDKHLDLIIVSHNHADHLKGLIEVLKHYTVGKIWISGAIHTTETYREFLELVKEKATLTEVVTAGTVIDFGELDGIVLFPFEDQTGALPDNQHDASVVSYWTYGTQSLLLMGDAEIEHEDAMLSRGILRPATVLKIGHHGSRTSTGQTFLETVQPQFAVIQSGVRNRFGHPAPETIQRLSNFGATILRNDLLGTIRFDIWPDRLDYATSP